MVKDPELPPGDARTVRPGEVVTYQLDRTPKQLRDEVISVGLDPSGIDFEKLAELQNDVGRAVPGWQAPYERELTPDWKEVPNWRDDHGGTGYTNAQRRLKAILSCSVESDGRAWLHLSVSHFAKRTPTYGEMRTCKELFLGDRYAYAVYPPKKMHVNLAEVLHLFALLDEKAAPPLPEFSGGTGSI